MTLESAITSTKTTAQAPAAGASRRASRLHIRISLLILLLFVTMLVIVDQAARSTRVATWLDTRDIARYEKYNRPFVRTHNFGDFFETLFLYELPHADYSNGGVYFFGSSNLVMCAEFGDLPEAQQKLIHNYGFAGADPQEIFQFIHYLVENENFLRAGGEKTCVILCLGQDDLLAGQAKGGDIPRFLPSYLASSGLFSYDINKGIQAVSMSGWEKALVLRRTYWRSFLQRCQRAMQPLKRPHIDPAALHIDAIRVASVGWNPKPRQMTELEKLFDYLNEHHIAVEVYLFPTGGWYDGVQFHEEFIKHVPQECASRGIGVIDNAKLLRDEEFMDYHHPTSEGAKKVNRALVNIATDFLKRQGTLPGTEPVHAR